MLLEFKNVAKTFPYEKFALIDDLSFSLEENEVLGIVIEAQWGKSTVAKLASGLQPVSAGSVLLDGKPLSETPPKERGLAVIFDDFALMKGKKFWVNAAYTLKIRGVRKAERKAAAITALERFGLHGKAELKIKKHTPAEEKLAVSLARASLRNFRLIIFDDTFSRVNYDAAKKLTSILTEGRNTAQMYLSSEVKDLSFCDRIVVVSNGKNVFSGNYGQAVEFVRETHCFDALSGLAEAE